GPRNLRRPSDYGRFGPSEPPHLGRPAWVAGPGAPCRSYPLEAMSIPDRTPDAPSDPPMAPRRPTVLRAHGDERLDDWYWLRERDDPDVIAYLQAENDFTTAAMADTAALQDELYAEIVARTQETDLSVPVRKGPWSYYSRTVEGRQYAIHCRRPAPPANRPDPAGAPDPAAP